MCEQEPVHANEKTHKAGQTKQMNVSEHCSCSTESDLLNIDIKRNLFN